MREFALWTTRYLLLGAMVAGFLQAAAPPDEGKFIKRTDAQQQRLKGAVHTLREDKAVIFTQDGKRAEDKRWLDSETVYNQLGNLVQRIHYSSENGEISARADVGYDETARTSRVEMILFKKGSEKRSIHTSSYDEAGRITQSQVERFDGKPDIHLTYRYDDSGREIESIMVDAKGTRLSETSITYTSHPATATVEDRWFMEDGSLKESYLTVKNMESRRTIWTVRNPDGSARSRYAYRFDNDWYQAEMEGHSGDGSLFLWYRYSYYEHDSHGNWTKLIESKCEKKFLIFTSCTPTGATYRTITYYPDEK